MFIHICMFMYMYIYIHNSLSLYIYIYIYTYIHNLLLQLPQTSPGARSPSLRRTMHCGIFARRGFRPEKTRKQRCVICHSFSCFFWAKPSTSKNSTVHCSSCIVRRPRPPPGTLSKAPITRREKCLTTVVIHIHI